MSHLRTKVHTAALVLALALSLTIAPDARASEAVYQAPRSINAKGQKDVTEQLLKFFAGVPDGSAITFPAGARYNIEGTLYLYGRNNLTFDGNGAEFFATTDGSGAAPPAAPEAAWARSNNWPRGRRQWLIDRSSGITIQNMTITGAHPGAGAKVGAYVSSLEAQHGIQIAGSSATVQNVNINDTYGDLISITRWAHDVVVRDSHLERSGRQGITVDGATDVVIERNFIGDIGRSVIDFEPPTVSREVRRVHVAHNRIGRANGIFVAAKGKGPVNDITILGNVLQGEPLSTQVSDTAGGRRANWRFLYNSSDKPWGSSQAMLRFWRVDGVTVQGNRAPIATTQSRKAVETWGSCNVVASSNQWEPYTPVGKVPQPLIPLTTDGYETTAACTG